MLTNIPYLRLILIFLSPVLWKSPIPFWKCLQAETYLSDLNGRPLHSLPFCCGCYIWLALGGLSFMRIEDNWRACHSPWLELVFRATNSHNHANPRKTALQLKSRITTQKTIWGNWSCILLRLCRYERQILCSLWVSEEMSLRREVSQVDCLVLLIYARIQGR